MSQKYILRRNNIDTEEDKYSYYVSCTKGVEVTTPFKDKASIFEEEDRIDTISKDWEFIKVCKKAIKKRPQYDDNKTLMKKPVLVHIFYSHPYLDTKHPTHFAFEIKTKLLVENVPYVGDSFNMEGLFSKNEIEKECRNCNPDFNGAIDLVLVKDRLIKYKNSEIDCIGLCVTEHATSAFGKE